MKDINPGRINCKNLTPDEWALLERLNKHRGWLIPTDKDWLAVRGVLALVEIRRGMKVNEEQETVQIGWPNIKINEHGERALSMRSLGKLYVTGKRMDPAQLDKIVINDPVYISCRHCDGTGKSSSIIGESCMDCDGDGYLPY